MVKKVETKVSSKRPTYASDFIRSDVEEVAFLGNPILDNMMTSIVALSSELWAERRRNRIVERLLAEKGISNEMIEGYMPSAEEEAEWQAERQRFIDASLGPLLRKGGLPVASDWPEEG